ncbi:MAG: hypothetical protein CUN55_01200 [Phototrophicales bacterium]|nr:MAG: hypothetical protein CUN55_01200 [Phototrophicales bacterium]
MPIQLHNGLILRSLREGTPEDREHLVQFYVDVFTDQYGPEDRILAEWIPDLLSGKHPTVTADDVFMVVDPENEDQIVSATLLIPQTWHYGGIPIPVGRPELVGTRREYRRQGLVRALFQRVHERSAELGHMMQVITGIPFYYRQFEYAMAIDLGDCATLALGALKSLEPKPDTPPAFRLRNAVLDDIPQIMAWERAFNEHQLLGTIRDRNYWEFEMNYRNPKSHHKRHFMIIENANGEAVGYVVTRSMTMWGTIGIFEYVVGDKASYLETLPYVLLAVRDYAFQHVYGEQPPYGMWFDASLYSILAKLLRGFPSATVLADDYAWYVRVPHLYDFIRHIQPVLEQRLEGSLAHRYTGKLHIGFYTKQGLLLRFEQGKIVEISDEEPDLGKADALFPYLTFLNVLFGYRTPRELQHGYPDVRFDYRSETLLNILFPKQRAWIHPQQ